MNFTLKEYFYKLYNRSLVMMLLPIAEFLAIYYLILSGTLSKIIEDELIGQILLISVPIIVLAILTIVHLEAQRRCNKIADEPSLGKRLDLYQPIARRKLNSLVWVSFLLAIGFFFTSDGRFSIYFAVIIIWHAWQWPSPRKVSSDLKLKGDERKMVMTKGEAFKV